MERGHCFFDGGGGVEAVDLVEVDIVSVQAAEGGIDGSEDGLAGEPYGYEETVSGCNQRRVGKVRERLP